MPFDTMQTSPNGGIINNPLGGLIEGIVQGAQLHAMIQREQDNHIAMQRQEVEGQRNMRLKDIQTRMELETKGRPIENGMVQDILGSMPGVTGAEGQSYVRKADSKRRVSYKNVDGQSIDFELFTPMEQIQRAVKEKTAITHAGQTDVSSILRSMNPDINLPDDGNGLYVNPAQVPSFIKDSGELARNRKTYKVSAEMKAAMPGIEDELPRDLYDNALNEYGNIVRTKQSKEADERRAKEQRDFTAGENDKNRQNRITTAGIRKSGQLSAAGLEAKERARERAQQADQQQVEKLQQEEQKLHGLRNSLGDAMKAEDDDTVPNPLAPSSKVKVNGQYRSLWKNRIDEAAKRIAGLQQTQKRLITKWGGDTSGAGDQSAAGGQTATPRRRAVNKDGDAVEWDGKAWVPASK